MPSKRKTSTSRKTSSLQLSKGSTKRKGVTKSKGVTKKKTTLPKMRMKSYVFITGPRLWADEHEHVAQVIGESRDGNKYALRINYNGKFTVRSKKDLRLATTDEKKLDPKLHRREVTMTHAEREFLNK